MTDYQYGDGNSKEVLCIAEAVNSGLPQTGAGYDYCYIQCTDIEIDGERLSSTKPLPGRALFNPRTGKKKHSITFTGLLIKKDQTSIYNDLITCAKLFDISLGPGVAPYYAWIRLIDGVTVYYFPFSDSAGTYQQYLQMTIDRFKFKPIKGKRIKVSGTLGECNS